MACYLLPMNYPGFHGDPAGRASEIAAEPDERVG